MNIIKYDIILDKIMEDHKPVINIAKQQKKINECIKKYKWEYILIPRHSKIIKLYIVNNYDFKRTAKCLDFSMEALHNLFKRIEAQFDLYKKDNTCVFVDINENNESAVNRYLELQKKKEERDEIEKYRNNKRKREKIKQSALKTYREKRENKLLEIRQYLKSINRLIEYLEKEYYELAKDVLEGLNLQEISIKRNLSERYLREKIIGLPNGKRKSNKGLIRLVEEGKKEFN